MMAKLSDASRSFMRKTECESHIFIEISDLSDLKQYIHVCTYTYMYTHAVNMDSFKAVYRLRNK